jgi:hypothetical protein
VSSFSLPTLPTLLPVDDTSTNIDFYSQSRKCDWTVRILGIVVDFPLIPRRYSHKRADHKFVVEQIATVFFPTAFNYAGQIRITIGGTSGSEGDRPSTETYSILRMEMGGRYVAFRP